MDPNQSSPWNFAPSFSPTLSSFNRQQAAARQLPRNRSTRGRNQRLRTTPYPSLVAEQLPHPVQQLQSQFLPQPSLQLIPPFQYPPPSQPVDPFSLPPPSTPPYTPDTMNNSKFATTTYNGDAMDIDTPSPVCNPRATPRSPLRQPGPASNPNVHCHLFYIPIQGPEEGHAIPSLDHDIIRLARLSLSTFLRQRMSIPEALPVGTGIPHLYILINTNNNDRVAALNVANRRLGVMQEMIRDGLGWFSLPYRHPNFEVKFLRNRASSLRYV